MNKEIATIEKTTESIKVIYDDTKKQVISLIKYYLETHGKVLFFNTDMKDEEGNQYLSVGLTSENVLVSYITKEGATTLGDINLFELSTIMSFPLFFRHTESKYTWVCEGVDGDYFEPCLTSYDSAEDAYQNMIDESFRYARSVVDDKEREGVKFNIDINFDCNVVTIDHAFKYYIIQTE